jgi:hypothetical protein
VEPTRLKGRPRNSWQRSTIGEAETYCQRQEKMEGTRRQPMFLMERRTLLLLLLLFLPKNPYIFPPLFSLSVSLYGSENMDSKIKDKSRLTAAEMRIIQKIAKYTWSDHRTNEEILNELKVTSILDKFTSYRSDWIQHVNRTPSSRLPNLLTKYIPRGTRNQGRPLKMIQDEWDRNRPTMAYFPESEMMMMMTICG